jgi:hypothetical protein
MKKVYEEPTYCLSCMFLVYKCSQKGGSLDTRSAYIRLVEGGPCLTVCPGSWLPRQNPSYYSPQQGQHTLTKRILLFYLAYSSSNVMIFPVERLRWNYSSLTPD